MNRFTQLTLLACLAVAAACGGSEATKPEATIAPAGTATPATTQPPTTAPADLGNAVFDRASEGIQKLTRLLENHPPADAVRAKVGELKEATIAQLVGLGRQYEALSVSDRAQVDGIVASKLNQAASADWYKAYATVTTYYTTEDAELAKQVQSFNVITQYAFFELLKKQDPAEAERLGIR